MPKKPLPEGHSSVVQCPKRRIKIFGNKSFPPTFPMDKQNTNSTTWQKTFRHQAENVSLSFRKCKKKHLISSNNSPQKVSRCTKNLVQLSLPKNFCRKAKLFSINVRRWLTDTVNGYLKCRFDNSGEKIRKKVGKKVLNMRNWWNGQICFRMKCFFSNCSYGLAEYAFGDTAGQNSLKSNFVRSLFENYQEMFSKKLL